MSIFVLQSSDGTDVRLTGLLSLLSISSRLDWNFISMRNSQLMKLLFWIVTKWVLNNAVLKGYNMFSMKKTPGMHWFWHDCYTDVEWPKELSIMKPNYNANLVSSKEEEAAMNQTYPDKVTPRSYINPRTAALQILHLPTDIDSLILFIFCGYCYFFLSFSFFIFYLFFHFDVILSHYLLSFQRFLLYTMLCK